MEKGSHVRQDDVETPASYDRRAVSTAVILESTVDFGALLAAATTEEGREEYVSHMPHSD